MSGEGPESIPTSADPRSRRPTKKRALSPSSSQAASLDALFSKPDQPIRVPPPLSSSSSTSALGPRRPPPPEIITNVQGSSAGAGSGEFHVYKAARRREYERLRAMDVQVRREREQVDFERDRAEKERRDGERTRRNREKRDKVKARKARKGGAGVAGVEDGDNNRDADRGGQVGIDGNDGNDGNDGVRDGRPETKRRGNGEGEEQKGASVPKAAEPVGLVIHDDD